MLSRPLLYLSLYFKEHRAEYYRRLDYVRQEGDWEAWLDFFLEGVENTATNAVQTAQRLVAMFNEHEIQIRSLGRMTGSTLRVFNILCRQPIMTLNSMREQTGLSFPSVAKSMSALITLGIVRELTGQHRNRIFAYEPYIGVLNEGAKPL